MIDIINWIRIRRKYWFVPFVIFMLPAMAFADETITTTATNVGTTNTYVGISNPGEKRAQSFTPSINGTVTSLTVGAAYNDNGTPSVDFRVSIYSDSAGEPGSELAYEMVPYTAVNANGGTDACTNYVVTLNVEPSVSASTKYWVVLSSPDGTSGTHYYYFCGAASLGVGDHHFNDGSTWSTITDFTRRAVIGITEGTSTPPTPEASTTVSTTTLISDPNRDAANGFYLFFACFFGIIWLFAKKR